MRKLKCKEFKVTGGSDGKNLPTMQETHVQSLGWEDPLEKGMATHSSIVAWKIPWAEEPGSLPSMKSQNQTWLIDFHSLPKATQLRVQLKSSQSPGYFPTIPYYLENYWSCLPLDKKMLPPAHTNSNVQGRKFYNPTQCLTALMLRKSFTYVTNMPPNNVEIHFLLTGFLLRAIPWQLSWYQNSHQDPILNTPGGLGIVGLCFWVFPLAPLHHPL